MYRYELSPCASQCDAAYLKHSDIYLYLRKLLKCTLSYQNKIVNECDSCGQSSDLSWMLLNLWSTFCFLCRIWKHLENHSRVPLSNALVIQLSLEKSHLLMYLSLVYLECLYLQLVYLRYWQPLTTCIDVSLTTGMDALEVMIWWPPQIVPVRMWQIRLVCWVWLLIVSVCVKDYHNWYQLGFDRLKWYTGCDSLSQVVSTLYNHSTS